MTTASGAERPSVWNRASTRLLLATVGLGIFAFTLRDFDAAGFATLLGDRGAGLGLILIPHAIGSLLHTAGFRSLLRGFAPIVTTPPRWLFAKLHAIVLASEAARMALPAGIIVGESVSLVGLTGNLQLRVSEALGILGMKKAWHLTAHSVWMVLLVSLGWHELRALGTNLREPWLAVVAALLVTATLVTSGLGTLALITSSRAAALFTRVSAKIPLQSIRTWALGRLAEQRSADTLHIDRAAHLRGAVFFTAQWGALVLETFVILRLLGMPIQFTQALTLEMGVVMIRALAFAVPGQVGVQDAGYVTILEALHIQGATELAVFFVLLRRGKEAFFIVVGFVLAAAARSRAKKVPSGNPSVS